MGTKAQTRESHGKMNHERDRGQNSYKKSTQEPDQKSQHKNARIAPGRDEIQERKSETLLHKN
jgi:hypothetical protein